MSEKKETKIVAFYKHLRTVIHSRTHRGIIDNINQQQQNVVSCINTNTKSINDEIAQIKALCSDLQKQQKIIIDNAKQERQSVIDYVNSAISSLNTSQNEKYQNIIGYMENTQNMIKNSVDNIKQQDFPKFIKNTNSTLYHADKAIVNVRERCKEFEKRLRNTQSEIILSKLREKLKNGKKIKICFSLIFDSVFPAEPIFEKFSENKNFETFILVVPDVSRGKENMFRQMNQTYDVLSKKYKNVYKSYDEQNKKFVDWCDKMDICFFANPYDSMTHEYYRIKTADDNNILTLFTNYGYQISNTNKCMFNSESLQRLWKLFWLDKHEQDLSKTNDNGGFNGKLFGYCKMDKLIQIKETKRTRKKIIIAPHHTVESLRTDLVLSNFLRYADFFIDLFKKYPDIDFVFRPHPLLWINLQNANLWTKQDIDKYLAKIAVLPNVEYQNGGEYLETFVNSDALIHDCGSFSAEYLFVNKPCCYMLKSDEMTELNSNDFHKKCIDLHYPAYNEQEIIDFIENVVIKNNDIKSKERQEFVQQELLFEYPNVSNAIYEYIKNKFDL